MNNTTIEWAERIWNPITGCSPVSEGCEHCYAERMSKRLRGRFGYPADEPFRVTLHPNRLEEPLKLRKPSRIFVCSMGDLFHEDVPFEWVDKVLYIIAQAPQHTFLMLTKRPERMHAYFTDITENKNQFMHRMMHSVFYYPSMHGAIINLRKGIAIPNLWLGVTAENQDRADERIPILLQTPAAVRFVSIEPMLGPVDLSGYYKVQNHVNLPPEQRKQALEEYWAGMHRLTKLDWVICGGETGAGARPMHPDWARNLRDQCQRARMPFYFKSWGEYREACPPHDPIWNGQSPKLRYEHGAHFIRLGAKRSGRLLDGCEWVECPEELMVDAK